MDTPEFPSNSERSRQGASSEKNISSVVSGGASRRRKSLRKQFSEVFVAGDAKTAIRFVLFDVVLPATQDLVIEAGYQFIERLFRGESRRRGATPPMSGPLGYVNYTRASSLPSSSQRALSRQARGRHNFDEIVLEQRAEAEDVIDKLFNLVSHYASASVADLYELVGLSSAHTDNKWGWTNLSGAGVRRIRGGYLLDLPDPQPLD